MPTYSKVVSVIRQIDTAHVFIGGTRKDITSGWTFVNGVRKQVFPSAENYTKIYENNTPGAYSTILSWGRYKIVLSGAGGSGGAGSATHSDYRNWANNGSAGQEITVYVDVPSGETKTVSGTLGQGGRSSYAYARFPSTLIATAGDGGTGYANGTKGGTKTGYGQEQSDRSAAAGGAGGGSSSVLVDGVLTSVANGGNGGNGIFAL